MSVLEDKLFREFTEFKKGKFRNSLEMLSYWLMYIIENDKDLLSQKIIDNIFDEYSIQPLYVNMFNGIYVCQYIPNNRILFVHLVLYILISKKMT